MFPLTITLHNNAQLTAVLAAMNSASDVEDAAAVKQATPSKQETKPAVKEAKQIKADSTKTATENAKAKEEVKQPTYDDVAAAITQVSKAKGLEAAKGVLAKFDVKRGPELKPEQYADVLVTCDEVLA